MVEPVQRRRGVQHEAGTAAAFPDQADGAIHVVAGLGVEADPVGAGIGEHAHQVVHGPHHQVHVDDGVDAALAQRLAHQRAHRQVGHVVVVHDVEVDDVGAGLEHRLDFLAEAGEVGGQDRRRDERPVARVATAGGSARGSHGPCLEPVRAAMLARSLQRPVRRAAR